MNVFINYRRDDTKWPATQLHAELSTMISANSIFIDVDSLPVGLDFREEISSWISQCDVFLSLIGQDWMLSEDGADGIPRLHNSNDLVRIEIEAALALDIPVVPVFVDGAGVPDRSQLPQTLSKLFDRNGAVLDIRTFQADVRKLFDAMQAVTKRAVNRTDQIADVSKTSFRQVSTTNGYEDSGALQLVRNFLETWSTWGFTPKRILNWGSQQPGFDRLTELQGTQLKDILDKLVAGGVVRTRRSKKGNLLYQFVLP